MPQKAKNIKFSLKITRKNIYRQNQYQAKKIYETNSSKKKTHLKISNWN